MADFDFVIEGRAYRAEKLSAIAQFQLSRKLAPLIPPLVPVLFKITGDPVKKSRGVDEVLSLIALAEPFADALAELKDEVAEQIMVMTLSSVKVETQPGTWIPLWIQGGRMTMVAELNDFGKLLPIVMRVIQLNLGPFITGFLTSHEEPAATVPSGVTSPAKKTGS